jgi:hypothetical protein
MAEGGNQLSRNPNVCASCSSLADGMDDLSLPAQGPDASPGSPLQPGDQAVITTVAEMVPSGTAPEAKPEHKAF